MNYYSPWLLGLLLYQKVKGEYQEQTVALLMSYFSLFVKCCTDRIGSSSRTLDQVGTRSLDVSSIGSTATATNLLVPGMEKKEIFVPTTTSVGLRSKEEEEEENVLEPGSTLNPSSSFDSSPSLLLLQTQVK